MIPQRQYAGALDRNRQLQAQGASRPNYPAAIWQEGRPSYPRVTQPRPATPTPGTFARYPVRLAQRPYPELILIPPLVSPDKPGTLVDPSAAYPCGNYDAYLEAKKRRVRAT
ncbi:hypothetical protein HPB50_000566 [Hyalomma asiaticum]|uniref:Uncharacterized protein n=1 Tax=Hyalomma asiaticum TaxID=266040 RepID=A0ACB7T105_HYAAI|nr:hypothetical protein HPB50_000566 [Hyalomma asiaticum]